MRSQKSIEPCPDKILKEIKRLRLGIHNLNQAISLLDLTEDDKKSLAIIAARSMTELRVLSITHSDLLNKSGKGQPKLTNAGSNSGNARKRRKAKALDYLTRLPGSFGSNSK